MSHTKLTWCFSDATQTKSNVLLQQTNGHLMFYSDHFDHLFFFCLMYFVSLAGICFGCKYFIVVTLSVKKWDQLNVFYKAIMIPQSLCVSLKPSCKSVQLFAVRK